MLFRAARDAGFRAGTRLGVLHGLVFYSLSLSWFWNIFQSAAVALWLVLALFTGLAVGIAGWTSRRWPRAWWSPLFVSIVWSALEYHRSEWFVLRFPWMTPGLALGPTWLSPWIGVHGSSWLMIAAATHLVSQSPGGRLAGGMLAAGLALLAALRPAPVKEPAGGIPVLMVQSENLDLTTYRERTRESSFRSGIALWPEYAAPFPIRQGPDDLGKLQLLAREQDLAIVFGTRRDDGPDRHFNEALTLDASGVLGSHDKNRPVPFMNDGQPGAGAAPVPTKFGRLATPICFDCDYTEVARRMTLAGAEAFTVPSLDAARWSARQHLQHAELFRHRALENGRWFAVCASSGMTQIIDPHGNRIAALPIMEDGMLRGAIHPRRRLTFYTRFGWVLPWLLSGFAVAWSAALGFVSHGKPLNRA
jgi:apolipoprotein N-acyltransferase